MRIKPKKALGQNFLVDKNAQGRIIRACAFSPQDTILEVGAGRGELTQLLAKEANFIYALEIDKILCEELKNKFQNYRNVCIICGDVLRFDINAYFSHLPCKLKVFGNIPYYITSPIIEHFFRFRDKIDEIFLTVQKEFAQRMLGGAGSKNYGAFSCFVKYFSNPQKIFYLKKGSFYPRPKVDSCFLKLSIREKPAVQVKDEKYFFKIIRAAFNQRRKTLKNSLKRVVCEKKLEVFLKTHVKNRNIRPEELNLDDFAYLANMD